MNSAYLQGCDAAAQLFKLSADESTERPWYRHPAVTYGAPLLAGLGTYALARKFRPSANAELRSLQMQAKDKPFEVATSVPIGRRIRSALFGARDIPHRQVGNTVRNSTVLHHTPQQRQRARRGEYQRRRAARLPG